MNSKDYVSHDTAFLLKKAGYPQSPLIGFAIIDGRNQAVEMQFDAATTPTLWDAMRWLRESKKLFVEIRIDLYNKYCWGVCDIVRPSNDIASELLNLSYPTYESAFDAGIAAACEYLLKT